MHQLDSIAPSCTFIPLALLAGLVAALSTAGRPGLPVSPLNVGALVFLGQFSSFIALAGLGLPTTVAQGAALTLGAAAAWTDAA